MLFEDITLLDETLQVRQHQYVGVQGEWIRYVGGAPPREDFGERYAGAGRLLMPGFYNCHAHTPMTLMRGYGENLPLQAWLNDRIFPFEARLTGEEVYWGMLLGLAEGLRYGIVSTSDMYNFCEDMAKAVLECGAKGNIGRHVLAFDDGGLASQESFAEGKAFFAAYNGAGGGRLKADFSLHAEYTSTPRVAAELSDYAAGQNARMQLHLSETRAEVEACKQRHGKTPPAYFADMDFFKVPTTAAHCVHLEGEDFALLAENGVTVASCPASNLKLASGVCNTPALYGAGVPLTLGTDSVASNNSLQFLSDLKLFALLPKGVFGDAAFLTPREALHAATAAGAKAQGRFDCGRLKTGFRADLIALDIGGPGMQPVHELTSNVVYSASPSDVVLTMVDGRVLYRDGQYTTLDIERVKAGASAAAERVLARF